MSDPVRGHVCTITKKPCDAEAILCTCVGCTAYCETLSPLTPETIQAAIDKGLEDRRKAEPYMRATSHHRKL